MTHVTQHKLLAVLLYCLAISACSSQPVYRAAHGSGYGYAEQQITEGYYRVSFKARGDDSALARSYALRRAAELTAAKGYDWFLVLDKETLTERERASPNHMTAGYQQSTVQHCSLLGCRTRTVNQPEVAAGVMTGSQHQVKAVLEIRLGHGLMPDSDSVYPALY